MKSLIFVMRYAYGNSASKKFVGQINAAANLGYDTWYIRYDKDYLYLMHQEKLDRKKRINSGVPGYGHYGIYNDIYRWVAELSNELHFDYAYIRKAILPNSLTKMLRQLRANGCITIMEIPTYPEHQETKGISAAAWLIRTMNRYCTKYLGYVNLFALNGENCNGKYKGRPAYNFENGVDCDVFKLRVPQFDSEKIHVIGLAKIRVWHGFDRLINGMAQSANGKKICFHIVGPECDESASEWRKLATDSGLAGNVIFHGPMYGEELDNLINHCDIGLGDMASHRKGITNLVPLKTREYMARGLPFLYASYDSHLKDKMFFCRKASNDDTAIYVDDLIRWAEELRQKPEVCMEMRDFAQKNLTWEIQIANILEAADNAGKQ